MTIAEQLDLFARRYGPAGGELGPERFVREQLHAEPDPFQLAVLRAYGRGVRHISIESCHGPGKTCVIAWLIVLQLCTWYPQKVAATAPTAGQMEDALLAEVKSWFRKLPAGVQAIFEVKSDRIVHRARPDDSFASFQTARPEQPEALQGKHSPGKVLLVADEGDGVPGAIFESALGSMSGKNACTILAGNPYRTSGFFFNANHGEGASSWFRVHVSALPGPHCGDVQPDGSGSYVSRRVDAAFVDLIRNEYGEESNPWRTRVLGRPPQSEADTVIPYEQIEAAKARKVEPIAHAAIVWGLDVARSGFDLCALAKRQGNALLEPVKTWPGLNDIMLIVGAVMVEYRNAQRRGETPAEILVDVIGLGAGVVDRLRELGLPVRGINVSENPALDGTRYRNLRTELWFAARDWFFARDSVLLADPKLEIELAAQKYKVLESNGKVVCIPKDEMRKYIHPRRSPDRADAFVLTFASTAATAAGMGGLTSWKVPLKRGVKGIV